MEFGKQLCHLFFQKENTQATPPPCCGPVGRDPDDAPGPSSLAASPSLGPPFCLPGILSRGKIARTGIPPSLSSYLGGTFVWHLAPGLTWPPNLINSACQTQHLSLYLCMPPTKKTQALEHPMAKRHSDNRPEISLEILPGLCSLTAAVRTRLKSCLRNMAHPSYTRSNSKLRLLLHFICSSVLHDVCSRIVIWTGAVRFYLQ